MVGVSGRTPASPPDEAPARDAIGHPHGSVGIVGAGISGLACARLLTRRGVRVRIFDKARGVGGRTSARREGDLRFDHGAQYFTARDERFRRHVATWMKEGVVAEWRGRIVALADGRTRPSESQTRYVGVPGMNAIAKHLSRSLEVTTRTRVGRLTRQADRWLLHDDANRELGAFDAVVLALPAPQAADLLTALPVLARQARACQLSPCWAVMVAFETPLGLPFDGAFIHDSPLGWIARNNSKPGRPERECWVLHASPEWSAAHLEASGETVGTQLLAALREAVGIGGLRPVHVATHRWRYALPVEPLSVGCLWEEATRVAVCGDWCQDNRIEGAFLSGLEAADRILALFDVAPGVL